MESLNLKSINTSIHSLVLFLRSASRPRIAGSLTNIQSSVGQDLNPVSGGGGGKDNENQDDEQKKQDAEDQKQREHSWKMMKYSFAFFGVSLGMMGSFLIYELARPNFDEEGNIVEDEFSNLPYFEQLYKRLRRELNYYKKVRISRSLYGIKSQSFV